MTPRERTLAMLVGGTLGLLGVNYGFQKYLGSIKTAEKKIDDLQSQIDDKENEILLGDRAARDFKRLSEQSLVEQSQVAQAQYLDWLTKLVADCGLSNVSVDHTNQQGSKIYRVLSFSVKGNGSLAQITNLLDRFYGREILHRISKMTVTPDMQHQDDTLCQWLLTQFRLRMHPPIDHCRVLIWPRMHHAAKQLSSCSVEIHSACRTRHRD